VSGQNQALAVLTTDKEPPVLNRRLGGTQNWSRYFGEWINLLPIRNSTYLYHKLLKIQ
jgi:hypothetical protein